MYMEPWDGKINYTASLVKLGPGIELKFDLDSFYHIIIAKLSIFHGVKCVFLEISARKSLCLCDIKMLLFVMSQANKRRKIDIKSVMLQALSDKLRNCFM